MKILVMQDAFEEPTCHMAAPYRLMIVMPLWVTRLWFWWHGAWQPFRDNEGRE